LITFQVIDLFVGRVDDAPGGRHEQDPTAINERLQEALAALLGFRILEPNCDRVTAQMDDVEALHHPS